LRALAFPRLWPTALHAARFVKRWTARLEDAVKKVLVGVDDSREAQVAADRAAEIARALDAQLTVACVVSRPPLGLFDSSVTLRSHTLERLRASELLRELSARYLREGTEVETVMPSGGAAETLAKLAAMPDVDLVVVGHRTDGRFLRALRGGTVERLAQISPKPLLVAR